MTVKQWENYYPGFTTQDLFNYYWNDYQNSTDYNTMYVGYRKCERALKCAIEWGESWVKDYVYDPLKKVAERIVKIVKKVAKRTTNIIYTLTDDVDWNGWEPIEGEQCYLVWFFDKRGKFLWTKPGTTYRSTIERMHEHLGHAYKGGTVHSIKVMAIWDCEGISATDIESRIRTYFIKKYGENHYIKNDRFDVPDDGAELIEQVPKIIEQLKLIQLV